jgi:integrative and conjugative element protein (TIGR02256 family)
MQILLTIEILKRLHRELRRAGEQEIGGLLMGEHVRDDIFRVVDISVQRSGGSHSCFVRDPSDHKTQLDEFFARTKGDYSRFNYLGEWHSHPSFEAVPSSTDMETMQSIVSDPDVGVNFLALMVVKLAHRKRVEATAMAFSPTTRPMIVPVSAEPQGNNFEKRKLTSWLRKILKF